MAEGFGDGRRAFWAWGLKGRQGRKEELYLSQGPALPAVVGSPLRLEEGAAQV